ncbi:hypothetical protein OIU76_001095 [Salix suchowensis]|nr:hypothetical protein OIU76_001095 [Salix suchowensis]
MNKNLDFEISQLNHRALLLLLLHLCIDFEKILR